MTLAPLNDMPDNVARWVSVLAPARQLAEVLARTSFVPKAMRDDPDAVCAAILYGDELGLGPMQALAGMDVVEGKPRPSAELARALILRDGHAITVHEATGTRVRVSGLRAGRPESERVVVEWTTDMARSAGLLGKNNWRQYPRAMLMARATGDLARILFPDVIKGLGHIAETPAVAADLDAWAPETATLDQPADDRPPVAPIGRRRPPRPVQSIDLPDAGSPPAEGTEGPTAGPRVPVGDGRDVAPPADLVPEAPQDPDPDAETPDDRQPMRETQRRGMLAAIGRLLDPEEGTREVRLALVSAIIGRRVDTSNDLTRGEATKVLGWLDDLEQGLVSFRYDPSDQTATVWRTDGPATDPDPWADPPPPPTDPNDPWAVPAPRRPS
jgi:hypothetical protein